MGRGGRGTGEQGVHPLVPFGGPGMMMEGRQRLGSSLLQAAVCNCRRRGPSSLDYVVSTMEAQARTYSTSRYTVL